MGQGQPWPQLLRLLLSPFPAFLGPALPLPPADCQLLHWVSGSYSRCTTYEFTQGITRKQEARDCLESQG